MVRVYLQRQLSDVNVSIESEELMDLGSLVRNLRQFVTVRKRVTITWNGEFGVDPKAGFFIEVPEGDVVLTAMVVPDDTRVTDAQREAVEKLLATPTTGIPRSYDWLDEDDD